MKGGWTVWSRKLLHRRRRRRRRRMEDGGWSGSGRGAGDVTGHKKRRDVRFEERREEA